jgi:hypothetical protein
MALDVPPPPADAAPDTSQVDQEAGGEEQTDPMADDPNALDGGQDDDAPNTGNQKLDNVISQVKQSDDPDGKLGQLADYGEKGLGLNTQPAPAQGANAQMPMESRFNFKRIIDEVFGEMQPTRPLDQGTQRFEDNIGEDAETEFQSPFTPGM